MIKVDHFFGKIWDLAGGFKKRFLFIDFIPGLKERFVSI